MVGRRDFMMAGMASGLLWHAGAAAASARFRVPAEGDAHERTLMQWPVRHELHPKADFLDRLQGTIADIANAVAAFEPVVMLAPAEHHAAARPLLGDAVQLWDVPTSSMRARDFCPIIAKDDAGNRAVQLFAIRDAFSNNAAKLAERMARLLDLPVRPIALNGSARAAVQDGHGLLIAHEGYWTNPRRNPLMTREQIEAALLDAFGADRVLWAPCVRDMADYQLDNSVRLTGPGRALISMPAEPDPTDEFHWAAMQTEALLRAAGLSVETIPEPETRRVTSHNFVASYANFYVCNGAVIAAQFGDAKSDAQAVSALSRHFPGREVVVLNVDPLGEVGGGIHSATHEVPRA